MAANLRLQAANRLQRISGPQHKFAAQRRWHQAPRRGQVTGDALVLQLDSGPFDPNADFYKNLQRQDALARQNKERTCRVRLSVHYRVHSRQMLCIGGSQIPFGWSFLSIAKVPMTWNQGDVWICEVSAASAAQLIGAHPLRGPG